MNKSFWRSSCSFFSCTADAIVHLEGLIVQSVLTLGTLDDGPWGQLLMSCPGQMGIVEFPTYAKTLRVPTVICLPCVILACTEAGTWNRILWFGLIPEWQTSYFWRALVTNHELVLARQWACTRFVSVVCVSDMPSVPYGGERQIDAYQTGELLRNERYTPNYRKKKQRFLASPSTARAGWRLREWNESESPCSSLRSLAYSLDHGGIERYLILIHSSRTMTRKIRLARRFCPLNMSCEIRWCGGRNEIEGQVT
jgi:hypothetical protein